MDADWGEGPFHQHVSAPSAIAFDTGAELVWVGQDHGRVASYSITGGDIQRYTAFKANIPPYAGPVRQFLFHERGVICLSPQNVHMAQRRGPPIWSIRHEDMKDLRCMSFTSKGMAEILVAGFQDTMFVIDVNKGEISKQVPSQEHYNIMKQSRSYICAATKTGNVDILDAISFKATKTWNTQSTYINDMDAKTDYIVTCGGSLKQGGYMLDRYVSVFDLKRMALLPPIPFPPLAAFIRMHPKMVTTGIVVSQTGQIHVVDITNPNTTTNVRQVNTTALLSMIDCAPTGEAIVFADSEGYLHIWGSPLKSLHITEFQAQLELDGDPEPVPQMDWSPETPLNTVGLPQFNADLLSKWPENIVTDVGAPPVKFDASYLSSLRNSDIGMYGNSNKSMLRNQVHDTRTALKSGETHRAPKFLSEKAKEAKAPANIDLALAEETDNSSVTSEIESLKADVPIMYRSVEIKFSKFGVDDFDFGYYNRTAYAGLENHIPNSYANSLLQVMHFTPILRNLSLQHAATSCLNEQCFLCELGFLSDMLEKAEGATCHASNFLKMLNNHPSVSNLGLLEDDHLNNPLTTMVQSLARLLFTELCRDYTRSSPSVNSMERMVITKTLDAKKCMSCHSETKGLQQTYVNDLEYPQPPVNMQGRARPTASYSFSEILKKSIERETTSKGWCPNCHKFQTVSSRRSIQTIPEVLAINAKVVSPEQRRLWATPGWLPEEIGIIIVDEHLYCFQGEDLRLHIQRAKHAIHVFSLMGVVANIDRGAPHKPHLVAMVNVAHSSPTAPTESQWHLFNDFHVKPVSSEEALTFNMTWKTPSVLFYQLKTGNNRIDSSWKQNLDTSILFQDQSPDLGGKTYTILDPAVERPGPETVVALDTEFVSIKHREIEVNSEGKGETIRPTIHSLARVSVIRANSGPLCEEAFIDDYILIKEPIVDYLTRFSGITPSDLDPHESTHNLVPLKVAFKKLWVLSNLGCQFLGHGLRQDFRVINIQVPKAKVIDTSELFFQQQRSNRKFSLAFLTWHLLSNDIQVETHDSIEDAKAALRLYRKYQEFEDAGVLETIMEDLYRAGHRYQWKAPRKDDQALQRFETPPVFESGGATGQVPAPAGEGSETRPSTPSRKPAGSGQVPPGHGLNVFTPGKGPAASPSR